MFEAIIFRAQNKTNVHKPLDIGMLLECMLFYKTTTVIANRAILKQLLIDVGVDQLIELIEENLLNIIYTESFTGIQTDTSNAGLELHNPIIFSSPQHTFEEVVRKVCVEVTGKEGRGRRVARRVENKIKVMHHEKILTDGARKSLLDQGYLEKAVPIILKSIVPIVEIYNIEFNTADSEKGIRVFTNIDFAKLNTAYHRIVPPSHSSITAAFILSHLFDVESDLYFSSLYLAELATNPLGSLLMAEKLGYLQKRSLRSQEKIGEFQRFVFEDARDLREAVNSKKVDITEVIKVIRKSNEFKKWLTAQDPSADLIKEYYKAVTKESFIDKLPGKSVRWAIFTALGLAADAVATGGIGVVTGITLGALDTFFIDKLLKGWSPSQFIEENVKNLLKDDS